MLTYFFLIYFKYEEQKAPLPKKETPLKTHNRMSKSMQENLSEIFKKIGLKEETEEVNKFF